uniref:Receptor-like protein kinase 5 n=1 Tax=Rhizophora mucronata TaxID=61149 RepID=A0A2P2KLD6_RHIMU
MWRSPQELRLAVHFLILVFFQVTHVNSQTQGQEQATLLRLKQHWQNPESLRHWSSSDSNYCSWPAVSCTDGYVTGLYLGEKNITGTIPPFITDIKNLTVLDFFNNSMMGTFPKFLYNLSMLESLDLSGNYFVGAIPDDIERMAKLSDLNLRANNFTGNIPAAIGRLQGLRTLQLHQNLFNGTFPTEIGNLSNLEMLRLAENPFLPSRLPFSFTRMKKLRELWISQANLIGEIPETVGQMEALEKLDLSGNELAGNIPGGLFRLKNLTLLYLYKNMLSGQIPRVVEALNLAVIDLSQNNLTGKIPDDFGKLAKLSGLALFFNQLSGQIPESIGRLPALIDFAVFSNNLSGPIPSDFGRYSMLETFQVASNRLTGRLPEYLCSNGKLVGVVAFDNNLSGELPESLRNCSSLLMVRVENNAFSGNIPAALWKAFNLSYLMLNDNMFTGELPGKVSANLSRLEISNNRFSGTIPIEVSSWQNLVVFKASNNLLSGTIPQELTALPLLSTLMLDGNQLVGALASDIISWKSLNTLNLSQNQLSGHIPDAIGNLPVLDELDLSGNQFSGQIPSGIGFLKLTSLNLSSNQLTGAIPSELENGAYVDSFLNNPGLCTSSSSVRLNICNAAPLKPSKTSTRFLALIFSASAVIFVLALLISWFAIQICQRRKNRLDSTWTLVPFRKLNFTELDILSKLTESNVIGSGGSGKVYRIAINHSDDVAVKKICNIRKMDEKLEKQFLAEVEILSTIRHLNVVKLLCCISDGDSKLLVYEYLENHSLDRWLHMSKKSTAISGSVHPVALDWPKRLKIAAGAAQGLCHMHLDCIPSVIHRDVKSSNILLDSEFNAKIADFGLAKMLAKPTELATVSAVVGSLGYIAPEYAHKAEVNEKVDVYSFGVVLLELTTGKEPQNGDEHSNLADWAWRHMREGKPISDALDDEIKEPCYLEEMSNVFRLGIMCTSKLPSARPRMKDVLQILLQSTHPLVYEESNLVSEHYATPFLKNSRHERVPGSDFTSNA